MPYFFPYSDSWIGAAILRKWPLGSISSMIKFLLLFVNFLLFRQCSIQFLKIIFQNIFKIIFQTFFFIKMLRGCISLFLSGKIVQKLRGGFRGHSPQKDSRDAIPSSTASLSPSKHASRSRSSGCRAAMHTKVWHGAISS